MMIRILLIITLYKLLRLVLVKCYIFLFAFTLFLSESYGEDIADTESEKSSDYGTKEEGEFDDFIDDGDLEMFPPSENRTSAGIVTELCFPLF